MGIRKRQSPIYTELGEEWHCVKCNEYWPRDNEFWNIRDGKPHSWCKACYRDSDCFKRGMAKKAERQRAQCQAKRERAVL